MSLSIGSGIESALYIQDPHLEYTKDAKYTMAQYSAEVNKKIVFLFKSVYKLLLEQADAQDNSLDLVNKKDVEVVAKAMDGFGVSTVLETYRAIESHPEYFDDAHLQALAPFVVTWFHRFH